MQKPNQDSTLNGLDSAALSKLLDDRFAKWKCDLLALGCVPTVLIGVGIIGGKPAVALCTQKEDEAEVVKCLLREALALVDRKSIVIN